MIRAISPYHVTRCIWLTRSSRWGLNIYIYIYISLLLPLESTTCTWTQKVITQLWHFCWLGDLHQSLYVANNEEMCNRVCVNLLLLHAAGTQMHPPPHSKKKTQLAPFTYLQRSISEWLVVGERWGCEHKPSLLPAGNLVAFLGHFALL